jgi:hypothetical protein
VHGITDAMVADAEPWEVVYGRLVEATWESTAIVVYNLQYDLGVINRVNDRFGLPLFDVNGVDVRAQGLLGVGRCARQMARLLPLVEARGSRGQVRDPSPAATARSPTPRRAQGRAGHGRLRCGSPPELSIREQAVQVADGVWQQAFGTARPDSKGRHPCPNPRTEPSDARSR